LRSGAKKISPAAREDIKMLLSTLDSFLYKTEWFAGDEMSLADLAILASVGTIKVKIKKYKFIDKNIWILSVNHKIY
jgi:glutathione S-transferase